MRRSGGSELNIFWRLCNEDFEMDAAAFRELTQSVWASFCDLNFSREDIEKYKKHDLSKLQELFSDPDFIIKYTKYNPVFTIGGSFVGFGQHPKYQEVRKVKHFEAFLLHMDNVVAERLGPLYRREVSGQDLDVFQARKASYKDYRRFYSNSGTLPPLPQVSTRKRLVGLIKGVSSVFPSKSKDKGSDIRSGHHSGPKLKK